MICIGVAEEEISENEDYICFQCRNPRATPAPTTPTQQQQQLLYDPNSNATPQQRSAHGDGMTPATAPHPGRANTALHVSTSVKA